MFTAVHSSTTQRITTTIASVQISDRALGVALASLLPALFWTTIYALVGSALGQAPGAATLVTVGLAITSFLAVVVGGLTARQS